MAKGVKPRIKVPKQASAGEAITIKTLISHKMETGLRKDADGNKIPQSIINRFTCDFNGSNVVDFDMKAGISVNPYFQITLGRKNFGCSRSGMLSFREDIVRNSDND